MNRPAPMALPEGSRAAVRRQLLIELSVLRSRYAYLSEVHDGGEAGAPMTAEIAMENTASSAASSEANADTGALCQSDRDAIEALFHSIDDFTRDFNEGKGELKRTDIISSIMRTPT